jgi:predicted MFS family arabinose efflux permease
MQGWQRIPLSCAGAMFVAMGLGRFSYSAMVPALVHSERISAEAAGWIGGANLAAFFLGAALSENLRRRLPMALGMRWAVALSVVALALSALDWGVVWLGLCRALLGVTAGVIMVHGVTLSTNAAPEGRRAGAAGIMFAGVGVGILFSGVLVPVLLVHGLDAAWLGIAAAGLGGAVVAMVGFAGVAAVTGNGERRSILKILAADKFWPKLAAAYFLFSFGITPHTLYWVDFLARELGLGIAVGGLHWAAVGLFAIAGPWAAAWLAGRMRPGPAVVVSFVLLGAGVAAPGLAQWTPVLWFSTMLFGAQPGVTTVKAARARDKAHPDVMPQVMRVMIMSSALGAAVGGVGFPALFNATGLYEPLFLIGGAGLWVAALLTIPRD